MGKHIKFTLDSGEEILIEAAEAGAEEPKKHYAVQLALYCGHPRTKRPELGQIALDGKRLRGSWEMDDHGAHLLAERRGITFLTRVVT